MTTPLRKRTTPTPRISSQRLNGLLTDVTYIKTKSEEFEKFGEKLEDLKTAVQEYKTAVEVKFGQVHVNIARVEEKVSGRAMLITILGSAITLAIALLIAYLTHQ